MSKSTAVHALSVVLASVILVAPIRPVAPAAVADGAVAIYPVPPAPSPEAVDAAAHLLGNPLNKPVTGAAEVPAVIGGERPPSLETLQAVRVGQAGGDPGLEPGREEVLHQAALTFGAQGGLAGRAFAINEMLRRYEAMLDSAYDFNTLVLPVGGGQTLMRPPVVTQAQMAFALGERPGRTGNRLHLSNHPRGATGFGAAKLAGLFGEKVGLALASE